MEQEIFINSVESFMMLTMLSFTIIILYVSRHLPTALKRKTSSDHYPGQNFAFPSSKGINLISYLKKIKNTMSAPCLEKTRNNSLRKPLKSNCHYGDIHYNYEETDKNRKDALKNYCTAAEMDPESERCRRHRCFLYFKMGNYAASIKISSILIEKHPGEASLYSTRGIAAYYARDYDSALKDFTKAIELNPKLAISHDFKGRIYSQRKQYQNALNAFNQSIDLNPDDAKVYCYRGVALNALNMTNAAMESFSKAIEISTDQPDAHHIRKVSCEALSQIKTAKMTLRTLFSKRPGNASKLNAFTGFKRHHH